MKEATKKGYRKGDGYKRDGYSNRNNRFRKDYRMFYN